jgi:hypothetical protein
MVGLLERGIGLSQGLYMHSVKQRKNMHTYILLEGAAVAQAV